MKKVTHILFDEEIGMPVFVLEDGTIREPYEQATGGCWVLSWQEDKNAADIQASVTQRCDECGKLVLVSLYNDDGTHFGCEPKKTRMRKKA